MSGMNRLFRRSANLAAVARHIRACGRIPQASDSLYSLMHNGQNVLVLGGIRLKGECGPDAGGRFPVGGASRRNRKGK